MLASVLVPTFQYYQYALHTNIDDAITWLAVGVAMFTTLLTLLTAAQLAKANQGIAECLQAFARGDTSAFKTLSHSLKHDGVTKAAEHLSRELATQADKLANLSRIGQALENSSTSFMLTDTSGFITHANKAVKNLFTQAQDEIRKVIPLFTADKLIGSKVDAFDLQHQLLGATSHAYETHIAIGAMTFRVVLNPIIDDGGVRIGQSLEWHDISQQLAKDMHTTRVLEALNGTTTNVMIADEKRDIIYMNKSVETMLRAVESELQKALPHFAVDKVIGSSVDIFHKDPSHQKRVLENLYDTYYTNIRVSDKHFRLIANPLMDETGNRLGFVVEWQDRTAEVAAEQEITKLVSAAVRGDFSMRAETSGKEGFILTLAEGLNQLVDVTEQGLIEISNVLDALAKGDLTHRINKPFDGLFNDLKTYCNTTNDNLADIIGEIRSATDLINGAASEIATGNTDLSARTEQQASSLEETASSMEEITSTVQLNATNAKEANSLASKATTVAEHGGNLIDEVVDTMAAINDSAKKISDIIGVIDSIAFQTNILALNAAVEAARAGEQGRGFAVVASEVRTLAQRSANAAKDIKALITDSVNKVEAGNTLVNQSGETMREIVTSIKGVNDIMSEITSASVEQASGIDEVTQAITQMDEMTQQNASLVEEAAAAAESMRNQATHLSDRVNKFILA